MLSVGAVRFHGKSQMDKWRRGLPRDDSKTEVATRFTIETEKAISAQNAPKAAGRRRSKYH